MPIKLAKLEDLQTRLDVAGDTDLLNALLEAVSAMCAQPRFAGVDIRREAGIVEYGDPYPACDRMRLNRYPVESIAEIKSVFRFATDADFDNADPLIENEDYYIDSSGLGVLVRAHGDWPTGPRSLRVTYTAGFGDPAELNASELEPPADLQHGILQQCIFIYNTRGTAGLRELNAGDQGGRVSLAESKAHADLVAACKALRRVSI